MSVGPAQILTRSFGAVTGRVTSVAVDPSDATGNTVVLGTAGGGVWRSVNAEAGNPAGTGATFTPLTDTLLVFNNGEGTASLSVGAVTAQPGGTEVLLAGTGEARPVADARYGEGLLRSADNGQTWTLVPESHDGAGGNHSFTGEGFAGFAWGPANTVVAAVGQAGDAAQVGAVTLGASVRGLYVSADAGATWQLATIEDQTADGPQIVQGPVTNYGGYDGNSALAVVWNPLRQMFYAVVQFHGVYGSPDGVTWTRLAAQPGPGLAAAAGFCPTDPGYAASVSCPVAQAALAVNASTGDMFAWDVDANGNDQGLWGDACGASSGVCANPVTFSAQFSTAVLENGSGQISDGTLGLELAVMPPLSGRGGTLVAGADSLSWCNLSTGCTWQTGCAGALPAGMRSLVTMTAMQQVMIGNEGGLWRVDGAGGACSASSFVNLNAGLGPIAQLESVAGTNSDARLLLSGAADMGSAATSVAPGWSAAPAAASSWEQVQAGFGGDVVIDAAGGAAYATAGAGVEIARCAEGVGCAAGASGFSLAIGPAQVEADEALVMAPYELDPANHSQMVVGTCRIWRGPANGAGWTSADALSPMLDGDEQASCNGNTLVRSVAAGGPVVGTGAAAESLVMYAGMQGLALNQYGFLTTNTGQLFVTTDAQNANGSTAWVDIGLSPVVNGGLAGDIFNVGHFDVSSVVVDAHDPTGATVYATIYGFHVPHVYRSTDFGAHWWNVSSNLPDVPVSAVVVDPNDANTVYVGVDTGVYFTQEIAQCASQACWQLYGAGLPDAAVTALDADGGAVGLLRAATYGRGAWEIPLATGALADQTTASLSASSLTFAGQAVSTVSAPQNLIVTVTGANALTLTSIVVTGDFNETDNCVGVMVASSCTVAVEFAPSATGARTGALVLYGNLPGGQAGPVTLSGTGLSPPQIVLSPSGTMGFGDEIVGESSAPQIVLVENTGQTAASLTGFAVSGAFAIGSNTCSGSLPAQTGCSVAITFTPTVRGTQSGTFVVTDSAGTQQLGLTGTGEAAASLALSPASLAFGAVEIGQSSGAESLTVTNSGDVSATVTGTLATGDFSISGNSCGEAVAGNSSCGVSVKFLPTQTGVRTGLLTVETGAQTLTAQLSGTGTGTSALTLTPATLNFGPENLQQTSAAQTMTLTNTGANSNTVTSITTQTATLGTADYAVSSNCGVLAVGANCTITVTFTPSVAGPDAGTLTVTASDPRSGVTAALNGSGNTLSWTPGQTPAATVPAGERATYAVELRIVGYSGAVALSCSGLPAGAVCQLPQNVAASESMQAQSVMFSVATGPDVVAGSASGSGLGMVLGFCLPLLGFARRRWVVFALAALLVGCGSQVGTAGARTPAGTYTFTVTAAGGGMVSSMPVGLVVE